MMKIRVVTFQGQPLPHAISYDFDEAGGTIGRAETNQLALPDPQRHISRLQARVVCRNGRFELINQGANPISVDGHTIGSGSAVPIASGARIEIGAYLIEAIAPGAAPMPPSQEVTLAADAVQALPRPAPPPQIQVPQPPPAAAMPPRQSVAGPSGAPPLSSGAPVDDPMRMFDAPQKPASGPLDDILRGVTVNSAPPAPEPLARPTDDLLAGWTPPPRTPAVEESLVDMLSKPAASSQAMPSVTAEMIPEDFDPFANPLAPPPTREEVNPFEDMEAALGEKSGRGANIDTMYELPRSIEPDTRDPFLGSSLGEPPVERVEEAPLDPLAAFARQNLPEPGLFSLPDQVPELRGAYVPPRVEPFAAPAPGAFAAPAAAEKDVFVSWQNEPRVAPPPAGPAAPPATSRPAPAATPRTSPAEEDSLLSLFGGKGPSPGAPAGADVLGLGITPPPGEDLLAGLGAPAQAEAPLPRAQPARVAPAAPERGALAADNRPFADLGAPRPPEPMIARAFAEPEPAAARPQVAAAQPAAVAAKVAPSAPVAGSEALTRAFLAGLGMPDLQLPEGVTPEMMERVGKLLREATQGTLDLLLARATTKREVRADVTMIVSSDNNPLKFSPDVSAALTHLLVPPQGPGFLAPIAAMRDAYDDLRSHQFGFMAGLRAALAGVLRRFDPAVLEQRLSQKSVLDSLLPMNRRAKLWDLYIALYRDIAVEAEDDFHTLFGREFLRAYQEQVDRLGQDKR